MLKNLNKKQKIIYGVSSVLILTVFVVIGIVVYNNVSYATGDTNNCLTTSLGTEKYKELEIIGSSRLSDEEGLSLIPMTFSIDNTCNSVTNYDLIIEVNRLTNVDLNNVKIDFNGEMIDFSSLVLIPSDRGLVRYTLKSGLSLNNQETNNNTFRIWESDSVVDNSNNEENILSVKMILMEK